VLTLKNAWLWMAGATLIPLAAGASTSYPATIVQNGAPISIDRCALLKTAQSNTGDLSEYVDFTNVSQRTAIGVRFAFEIVDSGGRTEQTLISERVGKFTAGIAIDNSKALPVNPNAMKQTIGSVPSGAKILCSVKMVRFDDGSVWHEGDGPAGSALIYTPLPEPSPTWRWPQDQVTP
jgi:hypothetical protein